MNWKKTMALALAGVLSLGVLGCGSSTGSKSADKKVKIEYWHVASESFGGATVKQLVDEFNKSHPNIEVTANT